MQCVISTASLIPLWLLTSPTSAGLGATSMRRWSICRKKQCRTFARMLPPSDRRRIPAGEEGGITHTQLKETTMAKTKKSIVFCHGIWADGSSFSKVIPALQAEGYEVIAAQYGLDTPEGDVATVKRTLGRVGNPAILVGHSYGGSVITAAGTDDRVVGSSTSRRL